MENSQKEKLLKVKFHIYGDDEIIHYKIYDELENLEEKEKIKKLNDGGLYIPIACFITAYAREKTIKTSQKIKDYSIEKYGVDKYVYSDTDSIHCLLDIEEVKQFCEIDEIKLGAWAHEGTFSRAKFIRQKCYLEEIDNEIKITCAGLPKRCYSQVDWKKFKTGFTCSGKLTFSHVKGGVILTETDFTIIEEKTTKSIEKF